jgi:4,5-dihydroxyphthalate decarboxylase
MSPSRGARYLLRLVELGELDAAVFPGRIVGPSFRSVETNERAEDEYFSATGVWPLLHGVCVREALLRERPEVGRELIALFTRARPEAERYLSAAARQCAAEERARFGYDPYTYQLGPVERRTAESAMATMREQQLLWSTFAVEDLFFLPS